MKTGTCFSILHHERPAMLRTLVDQLREELVASHEDGQIIVVDDGSRDDASKSFLTTIEAEGVVVLRKDHELQMPESWARNVNRGLFRSDRDVVWHFDDDCSIEGAPGWAGRIASMLREDARLGVCAPRRIGIMEPFVPNPRYVLSFGITEPCFAMLYKTFVRVGPFDEGLRWFYGPDFALRAMEQGLELGFDMAARQLDHCIRTGEPVEAFSRASGEPYYQKWTRYWPGLPEAEWPPHARHHERLRRVAAITG